MKFFTQLKMLSVAMVVATFSCTPENGPTPGRQNAPSLGASEHNEVTVQGEHPTPDPECTIRDTIPLWDQYGNAYHPNPQYPWPYGKIEMTNDTNAFYALVTAGRDWFVDEFQAWFGNDLSTFPLAGQNWDLPEMTYELDVDPLSNRVGVIIPRNVGQEGCGNWLGWTGEIVRLAGFFGGIDEASRTRVYSGGTSKTSTTKAMGLAYVFEHCFIDCGAPAVRPPIDTACVTVYPGFAPLNCTDISASMGTAYAWSTGETTQTITACPSQDTYYEVTVTDMNGDLFIEAFQLYAIDATCGNRGQKAAVCHIPPGNPDNPQDICISFSALPAHIEAFRTPEMNPRLGHDSGCHLGRCGSNPCD